MDSGEALIWLVAITVGILAIAEGWRALRQALERRARRERYRQAGFVEHSSPVPLAGASIGVDRAAAIRREAEKAARAVAAGQVAQARNPYPAGTQEFVLWVATYHLTLTELAEEDGAGAPSLRRS
jgi:hypothetical protein